MAHVVHKDGSLVSACITQLLQAFTSSHKCPHEQLPVAHTEKEEEKKALSHGTVAVSAPGGSGGENRATGRGQQDLEAGALRSMRSQ